MNNKTVDELFAFIEKSPCCYQAVDNMKQILLGQGYEELNETDPWTLAKGGKYLVTRNLSSLIAFQIPNEIADGFHITASHSDSPSFKIKENAEILVEKKYVKLNVEKYGGMILSSWFDRPLSVAGRVLVKEGDTVAAKLIDIDRDLILIPSLAIHMNKEINDGYKFNPQVDLLPLYGGGPCEGAFGKQIAEAAGVRESDLLGSDLFLYNRMPGTVWGADNAYISCGRLDDLQCAFSSMKAFLSAKKLSAIPVHCVLDNEEVGSETKQGAASTFLKDTLKRICMNLFEDREAYYTMLARSFMLSADNAHAVHPNLADKADPTNRTYMNEGIVIKYNAAQKYTTDGVSAALFKDLCKQADIPYQTFSNRSDIAGGSTLGSISNTQVSVKTVDIGLAQLAMHSSYETAGAKDTDYLIRAIKMFYECRLQCSRDGRHDLFL